MLTFTDIEPTRQQLRHTGGARIVSPADKMLYLVRNDVLGVEEQGLLITYEGGGTFFFNLDRPINGFRLIKAGFSLRDAPAIADFLFALFFAPTHNDRTDPLEPKRLAHSAAKNQD